MKKSRLPDSSLKLVNRSNRLRASSLLQGVFRKLLELKEIIFIIIHLLIIRRSLTATSRAIALKRRGGGNGGD